MSSSHNPTEYEKKIRRAHEENFHKTLPDDFKKYYLTCRNYSMLSVERLYDFYTSIKYVAESNIEGDIVEVGCFAGGAVCLARLSLNKFNKHNAKVYGYDTFLGHGKPNEGEVDIWGKNMAERYEELENEPWAMVSMDDVTNNVKKIVGSDKGITLVKGKVEETSLHTIPNKISVLRLDVDWYEPTLASLENFYPKLQSGGVIIVDDYGHHSGARKAVDLYFENKQIKFTHIDYSCIVGVKT